MVRKFIELALRNRFIVLLLAGGLFAYGIYSVRQNPIDAIPDLSENQLIVFTGTYNVLQYGIWLHHYTRYS